MDGLASAASAEAEPSRITFVLVVKDELIAREQAGALIERRGRAASTMLKRGELEAFEPAGSCPQARASGPRRSRWQRCHVLQPE